MTEYHKNGTRTFPNLMGKNGQCRLGIGVRRYTNFHSFSGIESHYDILRFT